MISELLIKFSCSFIAYDIVGTNDEVIFGDAIHQATFDKG